MNWKTGSVLFVLALFGGYTAYTVAVDGYTGFLTLFAGSLWGFQVGADLVIALTFVVVWMWQDAQARGTSAVPYIVATCFLGSIGPLCYLAVRQLSASSGEAKPLAA